MKYSYPILFFFILAFSFRCDLDRVDLCSGSLPSDGLVACYKFSGNAQDESLYGNHGEIHGTQFVSDRRNNAISAAYFDGANNYIKVKHSSVINFGKNDNFTISCWLKYSDQEDINATTNWILTKWSPEPAFPFCLRIWNKADTGGMVEKWYAGRYDGMACDNKPAVVGQRADDGNWHHVIFIKNGTKLVAHPSNDV